MTESTGTRPAPAAPKIDPRIRRRRIEVKRDEGRRRLRILAGFATVVLAMLAGLGLVHSPLLTVSNVKVVGARATDPTELVITAGLDRHPLMIHIDPGVIDRRLERLPWIRAAHTERRWPNTVKLIVTERVPVAQLASADGRWAAVDRSGVVIDVGPKLPDLITVAGLPPAGLPGSRLGGDAADALTLTRLLPPDLRAKVKDVAVDGGELQLHLAPAGTVRLGDIDRLQDKLVAVTTVLGKADLKNLKTIDVRVPAAPVVTRG